MSEPESTMVECPICEEEFDPGAAGGWCTNPDCGEWQYLGEEVPEPEMGGETDAEDPLAGADAGSEAASDSDDEAEDEAPPGVERHLDEPVASADKPGVGDPVAEEGEAEAADDEAEAADAEAESAEIDADAPDDEAEAAEAEAEPADVESDAADLEAEAADLEAEAADLEAEAPDVEVETEADAGDAEVETGADAGDAEAPSPDLEDESSEASACPDCGADVAPDDNFCAECGADLRADEATLDACPECGIDVEPDDSFCANCGEDLDAAREALAAEEGAAPESLVLRARGEEIAVSADETVGREIRRIITESGGEEDQAVRIHREHVRFVREGGQFYLVDLGDNPTRLNDRRLSKGDREAVEPGDEIELSGVVTLSVEAP